MSAASQSGLTTEKARAGLTEIGPNEPAPAKRISSLGELLRLFLNPLVVLLLMASVVSAVVRAWLDATIIVVVVLLGVMLSFVQTYRSRRSVERLRKTVAPTATVLRDGEWRELSRGEVIAASRWNPREDPHGR